MLNALKRFWNAELKLPPLKLPPLPDLTGRRAVNERRAEMKVLRDAVFAQPDLVATPDEPEPARAPDLDVAPKGKYLILPTLIGFQLYFRYDFGKVASILPNGMEVRGGGERHTFVSRAGAEHAQALHKRRLNIGPEFV